MGSPSSLKEEEEPCLSLGDLSLELPPSSSVSVVSSLSCSPNIIFLGFCFLDLRFSELLSDKFSAWPGESAEPVVSFESGLRLGWGEGWLVSRSGGLTVVSRGGAGGY